MASMKTRTNRKRRGRMSLAPSESLPRWESELRMLCAFWPPRLVLPALEEPLPPFRRVETKDPPPPRGVHPAVVKRYLRPMFSGGETFAREGYESELERGNRYLIDLPEPETPTERAVKKSTTLAMGLLGPSDERWAVDGPRRLTDPFQYRSPDELLRRVIQEVDELLRPLGQVSNDQLLRVFVREYVKRAGYFPVVKQELTAKRVWPPGDDAPRAFLDGVHLPRAFRRELGRLATARVDGVPRVAGVLLYAIAVIGTSWWFLRALDEESAQRRSVLRPRLQGFTNARRQIEAEWGLSGETLKRIDEETASYPGSLKLLMMRPDTDKVRWALRMRHKLHRGKPIRAWSCWTPVVGWLVKELRRPPLDLDTACTVVARLFNSMTARPLNTIYSNPFFACPKFRPVWSHREIGRPWNAARARKRYYRFEEREKRRRRRTDRK